MNDIEKKEKIEEISNKLKDILNMNEIESLLKSNEIVFEEGDMKYRVRKPSFKQKQEAINKRVEKFTELIKNDKYMLEEDLKVQYLKRGIDIDGYTKKIQQAMQERDRLMLKLGEEIKNKTDEKDWALYKEEIEKTNVDIQRYTIEKTKLLEFSIENQVLIYTYSYLTFLLGEKYLKGKDLGEGNKEPDPGWLKVWNTWEEFQNEKENLINKFAYYTTFLTSIEEL